MPPKKKSTKKAPVKKPSTLNEANNVIKKAPLETTEEGNAEVPDMPGGEFFIQQDAYDELKDYLKSLKEKYDLDYGKELKKLQKLYNSYDKNGDTEELGDAIYDILFSMPLYANRKVVWTAKKICKGMDLENVKFEHVFYDYYQSIITHMKQSSFPISKNAVMNWLKSFFKVSEFNKQLTGVYQKYRITLKNYNYIDLLSLAVLADHYDVEDTWCKTKKKKLSKK